MKTKFSHLYMVLMLLAIGNFAHAATITWTNTGGGKWSVAANWSPNQVPTNTDTALITAPGTYMVILDVGQFSILPNVANLTLGAGGGVAGVQTLLVTNLSQSVEFNVGSLLQVTNGGVLNMTNELTTGYLVANPLLIDKGGVFNGQGEALSGPLTIANGGVLNSLNGKLASNSSQGGSTTSLLVTNGGVLNANGDTLLGPTTVANGGLLNVMNVGVSVALTVAHGGVLNVLDYPSESLGVNGPLINSGTINVTNGGIGLVNTIYGGAGGLVNQTGGSINLQGSTAIGGGGNAYLINQGMITESAGTNSISCQVFDNSQGTVTNLSGILSLGLFQTNLAGIYNAAVGATIQFIGANNATPLTTGVPFVLGGGGQYQLTSGYLYLPLNVPTNLILIGDILTLGPGFQGGTITNLTLDGIQLLNALPVTGTLTATNSNITTNLTVASGGVLSYEGVGQIIGAVTVANGGVFNLINSEVDPNFAPLLFHGVTVAHGGIMNGEGLFTLTTLTNAGTINLTAPIILYGVTDGILNQAGGLINLGSNAIITIAATNDYFINQGMIVQNTGAGATNTISYQKIIVFNSNEFPIYLPFDFDTSQGTITNLSGTLVLPSFQGTLAGNYYAAAGTTIQLGGGTTNTPLVAGTPLMLGGSGQYQFISGYLYLTANMIPNLSLQGGQLTLGPGFQGGAITNLTLDGITFSNQSPAILAINGTFSIINSGSSGTVNNSRWAGFYGNGVSGNYTVAGGDVLNLSNATLNGAVTVTGGGVLNGSGTIYGAVTVANGGVFNSSSTLYGNLTVANGGLFNGSAFMIGAGAVTVASGGVLNLGDLFLFGPLTNSGTINITNAYSSISMYNNGMPGALGGVINQAGGLIDFVSDQTGIGGNSGGYEYLINQGRIVKSAGSGLSGIGPDFATNSGTITAQTGQILMAGQWTLLSPGSLNVGLNSATNYGSFIISTNYPSIVGNAVLAVAFNVTLNNGYVPTNGTTFNVLTYGSFTGSFSSLGLPSAVSWQPNYGSTNFTLVAGSAQPQFGSVNLSGTNLIFNGIGGPPGSNYVILTSTNLALALTNWSALTTNTFDGSGQFRYTNPVSPVKLRQFFIFKLP